MGLPLVDLAWQHRQVAAEIEPQLLHMMSTGRFVLGDEVERFEEEYARYCGVRHCIGVASGTDALVLSLRAVGLQPGDEVIVPANSFVASAAAVVLAGGVPVLVDVRDDTLLLDLDAARAAITARTRAIIPVHLFGRLVDMPALAALAADAGLAVIEDAAQAHGARAGSYWPGSTSELVATSFYPAKNLGAYGDAGAVLTNRSDLAERMLLLRDHGSPDKYHHEIVGTNSRLDALQAAVLSVKLAHLDEWNALRREAAGRYASLLAGVPGVAAPPPAGAAEHVWHLYTVRVPRRDRILEALRQASIGAGVHYPVPLHLQPALLPYAGEAARPVAERAASELLSLPIYPGITPAQQELVAATLSRLLRGSLSR
ncbi:MAG TPA: DegT/DnrJ/EryC1/StrS family aminotransferase, partial [Acidimicrobiales bacterium]|nr:DegT/DnrJ/EryC1/StrS family aminotransferase [Acidimicrobiales bacterium]